MSNLNNNKLKDNKSYQKFLKNVVKKVEFINKLEERLQKDKPSTINIDFVTDEVCKIVKNSKYKISLSVNKEVICSFWEIGRVISNLEMENDVLENFINKISQELMDKNLSKLCYSVNNIRLMKEFYETFPIKDFVENNLSNLPWAKIKLIIDNISDIKIRSWYMIETLKKSWTEKQLEENIQNKLHLKKKTSFKSKN